MSSHLLVVGSLNMDLVVTARRLPHIGETILGESFTTYPGGKGANQAVAAARLGIEVKLLGCAGTDTFGRLLMDNLRQNRVCVDLVRQIPGMSTGTALITVDAEGKNTIVVIPGANGRFTPAQVMADEAEFTDADLLIVQMEIPLDTLESAIALAKSHRVPVLFNPAPAGEIPDEIFNGIDYLVPNETELSLLTGLPTDSISEIRVAAGRMLAKGTRRVILTRGDQGVYYCDTATEIIQAAYTVPVVDTTAAGDAFIGGFASAILRNEDIPTALRTGSAAGALAATRAGAQTSLPTLQELKEFLKKQN